MMMNMRRPLQRAIYGVRTRGIGESTSRVAGAEAEAYKERQGMNSRAKET